MVGNPDPPLHISLFNFKASILKACMPENLALAQSQCVPSIAVKKEDWEPIATLDSFGEAPDEDAKFPRLYVVPILLQGNRIIHPGYRDDCSKLKSEQYLDPDKSLLVWSFGQRLADSLLTEVKVTPRVKQKLFNSWLDVSAGYKDTLDRRRPWFSRLSGTDTAAAPAPSRSYSFCLSLTLSLSVFFE